MYPNRPDTKYTTNTRTTDASMTLFIFLRVGLSNSLYTTRRTLFFINMEKH